jgi:beta-lactamase regulating signal transducer with metallopeptidase domain
LRKPPISPDKLCRRISGEMEVNMNGLVRFVLGLSLAGGATCLVVAVLGLPLQKLVKKSWLLYLWLVVLLRFVVPAPLNLPLVSDGVNAIMSAFSSSAPADTASDEIGAPAIDGSTLSNSAVQAATADNTGHAGFSAATADSAIPTGILPVTPAVAADPGGAAIGSWLLRLLPYIWLAGASVLLLWTVVGYGLTLARLRRGRTLLTPGRVPVYENDSITTPVLAGILRPVIYLPAAFPKPELAIRHELTHLRRGDIWLKWLVQLVVCVHWFNPLAWLMKRALSRHAELACDDAVVRRLDPAERTCYGQMLLNTAVTIADHHGMLVASLGGNRCRLAERIIEIVTAKKTTGRAVAAMSALTAVILTAAVLFGAFISGCSTSTAAPKADDIGPAAVTEPAPSASQETAVSPAPSASQSPAASPSVSETAPVSPAASTASPTPADNIVVSYGVFYAFGGLPFDGDPDVTGIWQLVGAVDSIDSFEPVKPQSPDGYYKWNLIYGINGGAGAYICVMLPSGYEQLPSKSDFPYIDSTDTYEIRELGNDTYMFVENKDADGNANYSVWIKISDTPPTASKSPDRPPYAVVTTTLKTD